MKIKNLVILTSILIIGSQAIKPQSKTGGELPLIDISKQYPKKQKRLQDMADIEYIPLETTDDVLLSDKSVLAYVSDKYILVYDWESCDIYVFNRSGKIYSHFNRKGQSGREFVMIGGGGAIGKKGVIFDEKNEEIFVCTYSESIQVYSLNGEHKRTLKVSTLDSRSKVFNFDDETLLCYDDFQLDLTKKSNPNTNPYSLISKKDGSLISVFDIHLPERNATYVIESSETNMSGTQTITVRVLGFPSSMNYGQDFMIADISSDTLYLLTQNKELTPLLTRKPSSHADPKILWVHLLTTDKFIILSKILLDFKGGGMPHLIYEFETGEISEWSILDVELRQGWSQGTTPAIAKNMTAELIWPSSIIAAYKAKQLKGDVAKLAKTLDEEDNPIVRIIKFK